MNGSSVPDLERILFYSGQQLQATDLTELVRARREMLWLHTRSLHSWGIGIGFGVGGKRGDSVVSVSPGYGVDCLGREILLSEARTLTVPAVGNTSPTAIGRQVVLPQADGPTIATNTRSRP